MQALTSGYRIGIQSTPSIIGKQAAIATATSADQGANNNPGGNQGG
jgi:hypothetical protein